MSLQGNLIAGVEIVLVSPQDHVILRAFSLTRGCTNNVAKCNAFLINLQIARELGVKNRQAYGDSEFIVCQVKGEYEVKHEKLISYYEAIIRIDE